VASALKVPPHSIEAEQSVLGGLLLDNAAWEHVVDVLGEDDFYRRQHRVIFAAIRALADSSQPLDVITLSEWLGARDQLESVGGLAYLGELAHNTPSAANIRAYAEIVRERAVLRALIRTGTEITEAGFVPEGRSAGELVDYAEGKIFELAENGARQRGGFTPIKDVLVDVMDHIDMLFHQDSPITGVSTGFTDLDEKTSGLQHSDLIIVAGRPSMGKCIVSGSRIVDPATGAMRTIDDMVGQRDGALLTLGEDLRLQRGEAAGFVDDGWKPAYRVRTRSGREIRTTASHPFLTIGGWRALRDLRPGEPVAVPRRLPVFGSEALAEHEVKLLAYFLGDGCPTGTSPAFTNRHERLRCEFEACVARFANVRSRAECHGGRVPASEATSGESAMGRACDTPAARLAGQLDGLAITARALAQSLAQLLPQSLACSIGVGPTAAGYWRREVAMPAEVDMSAPSELLDVPVAALASRASRPDSLTAWLEAHGLRGCAAADKRVPSAVFRLPEDRLALFLNRLFSCDGRVDIQNCSRPGLSYRTVSEGLARDAAHLLLRFGVLAQLRRRQVPCAGSQRRVFELSVLDPESLLAFVDRIGVFVDAPALDRVRDAVVGWRACDDVDTAPAAVWEHLLRVKGDRSWRSLFEAAGLPASSDPHAPGRELSRRSVAMLARELDDAWLQRLSESDVLWDPIQSIEALGACRVFDLTVPGTHNFVAEDVLVHNTAFSMNLVEQAAIKEKLAVAVFSMEMPAEQLTMRMLSSLGRIDQHKVRIGKLADEDWPRLTSALSILNETDIYIDDTPALTPSELRARCRRLKREKNLGLVVVDYLQLMQVAGTQENRATEISEISRSLKALAKELRVPVVALSQLNRSLEQRPDKRPVMSDLRESGAIEQDADVILFIYRDEVYNDNSEHKGKAEIIIGKQRNGPIGKVMLTFLGQHTRFENYIPDPYAGSYPE
jgi:replicative DNA helicase